MIQIGLCGSFDEELDAWRGPCAFATAAAARVWVDVETIQGCSDGGSGGGHEPRGGRTRLSDGPARRVKIGSEGRQNGPGEAGYGLAPNEDSAPGRASMAGVSPYTLFCHGPRGIEDDRTRPAVLPFLSSPSSITSKASLFPPPSLLVRCTASARPPRRSFVPPHSFRPPPITISRHHARAHSRDTTETLRPGPDAGLGGARTRSHQPTHPPTRSYRVYPHPRTDSLPLG